jgi:hypothetical protein
MAKFIHYFTRYRAHLESADLENRIRKETIMRIKVSLRRSDRGDLEWLHKGAVDHPYKNLSLQEAQAYKLLDDDVEMFANSTPGSSYSSPANPTIPLTIPTAEAPAPPQTPFASGLRPAAGAVSRGTKL